VKAWDRVKIIETSPAPVGAVTSGKPIQVQCGSGPGGLEIDGHRVEAVLGRVGPTGALEDTEVHRLAGYRGVRRGDRLRQRDHAAPHRPAGLRITRQPDHYDDPLTRPCPDLLRWG